MTLPPAPDHVIPERCWGWLGTRRALAVVLWLVTLGTAAVIGVRAYTWFANRPEMPPERHRADGNGGHAQIDFGGQWLMGRMLVTGHGKELYHRQRQREVLRTGYPDAAEAPAQRAGPPLPRYLAVGTGSGDTAAHDVENLMGWFMGTDPAEPLQRVGGAAAALAAPPVANPFVEAALQAHALDTVQPDDAEALAKPSIGGPLYPPVHALFYAPLGALDSPQRAYRVFQAFSLLVVFLCGLGVKLLTRGRVWWSAATFLLLLYPGTRGAMDLGQNPAVSLCILIWGWVLMSRGYPVAGGVVWGLFAFKPVWALAFFLVPLVMRRWRFCAAMALTGAAWAAVTLPFVGLQSWFDWLAVGTEAAELYKVNDNWIHLSRDLHGIPRRALHDFTRPEKERETALANGLAWGLWGLVFVTTAGVYLRRGDRARTTGPSAGLLLLGAYLTCYRFMYYDVLLSAAALAVLLAGWPVLRTRTFAIAPAPADPPVPPAGRELPPAVGPPAPFGGRMLGYVNSFPLTAAAALYLIENSLSGLELGATVGVGFFAAPAPDSTVLSTPKVRAETTVKYPLDTFVLLALWAWCAWRVWRGDEPPESHKSEGLKS